jgi:hypothetical protein
MCTYPTRFASNYANKNAMKIALFVLFILCAAAVWGQTAPVLPNQVQMVVIPEHVAHASQHEMATEHPLVGGGSDTYTYAQGERPLWEFGPVSEPTPLGDIARVYRREKLALKKAEVILNKQGQ